MQRLRPQPPGSSFGPPPAAVSLPPDGHVAVWALHAGDLADELPRAPEWLSTDEAARLRDFRLDRDRTRFLAARSVLRLLLSAYARVPPSELRFGYGPHGKPHLQDAPTSRPSFNLAHTDDVIMYAVSRAGAIGIDLERVHDTPDLEELVRFFFSESEQQEWFGIEPGARRRAFFACWTRKEAYAKARGLGMALPSRRYTVTVDPDALPRLLHDETDPAAPANWHLLDVSIDHDLAGAIASSDRIEAVQRFALTADWIRDRLSSL